MFFKVLFMKKLTSKIALQNLNTNSFPILKFNAIYFLNRNIDFLKKEKKKKKKENYHLTRHKINANAWRLQ